MAASDKLVPSYDNALHLLSLLQSNKNVINLFTASPGSQVDINASAIPEMTAWLSRAGYAPRDLARLRCIHVAGSKGKGSTCAFTSSILRQYPEVAGRVGTYTSPHLVTVRERICLDGEAISQDKFTTYFFEMWNRLSDAARKAGDELPEGDELGADGPSTKPFYFRFLTLLAFHAFLREGIKSAVIECGIGGEYDSTNVLPPEAVTASAVTQLGIDHVAMLGDTVEKIAWHKAGIFKDGVPAYFYQAGRPGEDGVSKVLGERAHGRRTTVNSIDSQVLEKWAGVRDAQLEGAFQKANMALATVISRRHLQALGNKFERPLFESGGSPLPSKLGDMPEQFITGLRTATLRGRCETITHDRIQWYLDGAHTKDSLVQVGRWYAGKISGEDSIRILIFNQQDRDSAALLKTLLETILEETEIPNQKIFHHAFCPTNEANSFMKKPDFTVQRKNCDVIRQFCPFTAAIPADSISTALDMARNVMLGSKKSKDNFKVQVLVTGSFNLVGPALNLLEPGGEP
ncbi:putative folylpolyglutamate synthase [Diaporthe ampelina]|uniref:Folylpolyglutamate synthase n=1 Tax=Diaporthe ampelina TaxID=1214573 RepID=A0A0G2FYQ9_9PEZI|nr:putative folylpolyglutamate synthase [Diaporthe ampelina]